MVKKYLFYQSRFFSQVHSDLSLEKSILGSGKDIEYIAALSFYNRHWSLILVHAAEKLIYYLDPLLDMFRITRSNKT